MIGLRMASSRFVRNECSSQIMFSWDKFSRTFASGTAFNPRLTTQIAELIRALITSDVLTASIEFDHLITLEAPFVLLSIRGG